MKVDGEGVVSCPEDAAVEPTRAVPVSPEVKSKKEYRVDVLAGAASSESKAAVRDEVGGDVNVIVSSEHKEDGDSDDEDSPPSAPLEPVESVDKHSAAVVLI